jgi:hypothetical protein
LKESEFQGNLDHFEEEGEGFLLWIVTGDETWVHHDDPENKRYSMEYHHKRSPVPKKFQAKASAGKVMLTLFWNSEGVVRADFLQKSATMDSEHYIETIKGPRKRIMKKGAEIDDVLLQQDNARPHTSAAISDAIACLGFTVLPRQAYGSDLTPRNFHLFPKLKEDLRGQNFSADEEVKAAVHHWFREEEGDFLRTEFKNFLNVGKSISKLEEIMWKSDYEQL